IEQKICRILAEVIERHDVETCTGCVLDHGSTSVCLVLNREGVLFSASLCACHDPGVVAVGYQFCDHGGIVPHVASEKDKIAVRTKNAAHFSVHCDGVRDVFHYAPGHDDVHASVDRQSVVEGKS